MEQILHALAKVVRGLMAQWNVHQVIAENDGKHKGAPDEATAHKSSV